LSLPHLIKENVPLNGKTTYRIGGEARYYCCENDLTVICAAIRWAHENGIPLFVLGKGSNVLISDQGWPGLVLHMESSGETSIHWEENTVEVSGSLPLNLLVKAVIEKGFSGMEELAGIPGTVGGAVVMNAGAYAGSIAHTLSEVLCCDPEDGTLKKRKAHELQLGYRMSILKKNGEIVLNARFSFDDRRPVAVLNERRQTVLEKRKMKQPLEYPNCGSVFKRPPGNYAGTLIEQCGLKGLQYGGARISEKHGNFIVNTGNAKADDVRHLICVIRKNVYERFGILLEPEVIFIGSFKESLFVPLPEENP
jgi:UDP-N-acetylmuramate dehydrogenase